MNVTFGTPAHGWLEVRIETDRGEIVTEVSDVGPNSIKDLVCALVSIASGSGSEFVEWNLEPEIWSWALTVSAGRLDILVSGVGGEVAKSRRMLPEALEALCGSLTRLSEEVAWSGADLSYVWSWPFPTSDLARLRSMVLEA